MIASLIGFVFGALLGAITGTEVGICVGAAIGALIGFSVYVFGWMRSHFGDTPTAEHHRVMCAALGQVAECEFAGDLGNRRWNDVRRCTLLSEPTRVDCDKGCVGLLNAARIRPGRACACEESSRESSQGRASA